VGRDDLVPAGSRSLALAALVAWIVTESLGAYMLRSWFKSGAAQQRHARADGMSLPVLLSHAGLNLAGLLSWISFLVTGAVVAAWLALLLLAPAIGLGISTVTVWTPYPAHRPGAGELPRDESELGVLPDELIERALADDALASKLVDELLDRNLAVKPQPRPRPRSDLRPLVPLAHGVLAVATFLLTLLAAITALR
jgi:hypothetical protein